jgi:hypothetical protein
MVSVVLALIEETAVEKVTFDENTTILLKVFISKVMWILYEDWTHAYVTHS